MLLVLLIDVSESMRPYEKALNSALSEIKKNFDMINGNECKRIIAVQFSSEIKLSYKFPSKLAFNGRTALYDAIYIAANYALNAVSISDEDKCVVGILTDGENNKGHVGAKKAAEIIEKLSAKNNVNVTMYCPFPDQQKLEFGTFEMRNVEFKKFVADEATFFEFSQTMSQSLVA